MPNTSDSARTSSTLPSRSWTEETGREKSRSRVIWSNQKWLEGKKFSNWRWECSTVFLLYVTKTIVKISFMYSMLLRQILHLSVFDKTISKICFRPITNHYLGRKIIFYNSQKIHLSILNFKIHVRYMKIDTVKSINTIFFYYLY
jgi:hypothetical protein